MNLNRCQLALISSALISLLWLHVYKNGISFFHDAYPQLLAKRALIADGSDFDTVILGDSKALASLDTSQIPSSVSLALLGISPVEAHVMLMEYLNKHPAPKTILYSMSPIRFTTSENFWVSTAALKMIPYRDALEFLRLASEKNALGFSSESKSLGPTGSNILLWLIYSNFPLLYGRNLGYGKLFLQYRRNQNILRETTSRNGFSPFCSTPGKQKMPGRESNLSAFTPNPAIAEYFEKTLLLAQASGTRVYFIATPTHPPSWDTNLSEYYEEFRFFLERYANRYSNFSLALPPSRGNSIHFADKDHMNASGARVFSRRIAKLVFKREANPAPEAQAPSMCP